MKQIIPNYTFNASNGQITFTDFSAISLENVLLVTNVTDGIVVYQFQKPGKLGSVSTNVLDLQFDTSGMSNGDDLQIIYHCEAGDPNYNETLPVSGPLTDAELRATPIPVSGTITSTGGLTNTELRATPVPVSASALPLPAGAATSALQTQPGVDIGDVTVNNASGASAVNIQDGGNSITVDGPLTDAQLRAVAVPVSGTVTTGGLTDTQLRATPVPMSGTVTANAGTNLNTSALALESGGNLAAIKADVDKIPSQGQALSAASMPVVLPAAQITTLTPPSNTGYSTSALQTTGNTSLGTIAGAVKAEDAVHASGDVGIMALAVRSDADTPLAADGDYVPIVTNQYGRVKASVLPAATTATTGTITTGTGTVEVDTARQSGVTLQVLGTFTVFNAIFEGTVDGTNWFGIQAVRTNSNTVESNIVLTGAPTYAYKISANNLVKVRIRATSFTGTSALITFLPTAFASDPAPATQRTRRDLKANQTTTITSSTTETTVLTAQAGTYLDVHGVIVANTSATPCEVTFKDATAGTVRFTIMVPALAQAGFMLPSNDGYTQAVLNNNWTATCATSVASVKITVFAVKNT
jgi:hypothetical protein